MRDGSLQRKAKECARRACANLEPSSLPCIHAADSPYLVTIEHRRAHGAPWTLVCSLSQADRRAARLPTVIREDKIGKPVNPPQ